jgi:hypothetical protein
LEAEEAMQEKGYQHRFLTRTVVDNCLNYQQWLEQLLIKILSALVLNIN